MGLQFFVVRVHPTVPVGVSRSPEFPTFSGRKSLNRVDELLQSEGHIQQDTLFKKLLVRRGWCGVRFGVRLVWYLVRYGALECHFFTDREGRERRYFGHFYVFIVLISLVLYGGEGGIRTPGTLASTSDFESGAFNRALPPLRFVSPLGC